MLARRRQIAVSRLPEELREGLDPEAMVTLTIDGPATRVEPAMTLEEIFAARRPPYRSGKEIDAEIRAQRDEWDD